MRRPLGFVALGVALVALDFRTALPDLLPDPLGWALVGWGAWRLAQLVVTAFAGVAGVLSLADFELPYTEVCVTMGGREASTPWRGCPTRQRWDTVSDPRALAIAASVFAGGIALWLLLGVLADRAALLSTDRTARRIELLRWVVPGVWTLPTLGIVAAGIVGDGDYNPVWPESLELVWLAGFAVLAWLVVELARYRDWTFAVKV